MRLATWGWPSSMRRMVAASSSRIGCVKVKALLPTTGVASMDATESDWFITALPRRAKAPPACRALPMLTWPVIHASPWARRSPPAVKSAPTYALPPAEMSDPMMTPDATSTPSPTDSPPATASHSPTVAKVPMLTCSVT
eukprot:6098010-Pleurochrysis_carterae.AAC.1